MSSNFILAFDTTSKHCAACILNADAGDDDGRIIASETIIPQPGHAEKLFEIIGNVLEKSKLSYAHLNRIVTATGPGNFTGIRVGLAAARSLGLALDVPVIGVSNLESCAKPAHTGEEGHTVLCVLDARNGNAYCQWFGTDISETPVLLPYAEIAAQIEIRHSEKITLCGSGVAHIDLTAFKENIDRDLIVGRSLSNAPIETLARLGAQKPIPDERISALYIRKPDAKIQAGFAVARKSQTHKKAVTDKELNHDPVS